MWANWSLREGSEFDAFYEEWLEWFPREAPVGQGTLMPLSQRRAGFRISIGVIAASQAAPMSEGEAPARIPAVIPVKRAGEDTVSSGDQETVEPAPTEGQPTV